MTISFEVSPEVEALLSRSGQNPSEAMKEAALVDLYRRGEMSQYQLAQALGLHRLEVDGVLKRHKVFMDITAEEVWAQVEAMRADRAR